MVFVQERRRHNVKLGIPRLKNVKLSGIGDVIMPGNDFNRLIPGQEQEKFTEENYTDLQARVVKMERILAENVRQWNAPSLARTMIDNVLVDGGIAFIDHSGTYGAYGTEVAVTFTEGFDTIPVVVTTRHESTLDTGATQVIVTSVTTTGCIISITGSGNPTSGSASASWVALGLKAQT